jgi:hypothetical protein
VKVFSVAPMRKSSGERGEMRMSWSEKVSEAGEEKYDFVGVLGSIGGRMSCTGVIPRSGCSSAGSFLTSSRVVRALFREGGRGRGLDRLEEANSSVSVGSVLFSGVATLCSGLGVEGIGKPFALPRAGLGVDARATAVTLGWVSLFLILSLFRPMNMNPGGVGVIDRGGVYVPARDNSTSLSFSFSS